jgi:hypothetical protein
VARAEDERHALMDVFGRDIEDAFASRRRRTAGLFHDHRHRVRFVEQPQAALT